MKLILIEFRKLKNSKIYLPILILPLISVVYGTMNYSMNTGILKKEWISLWTQVYLFYGLFFSPSIIGIIASYLWTNEHKNNNMNLILSSNFSFKKIILAKIFVALVLVIVTQVYLLTLYTIAGHFFDFTSSYPVYLIRYVVLSCFLSVYLISVQSYLSLKIKFFSPPVALSIILSLGSLVVSQNQVFPQIKYLLSITDLTLAMNHYSNINYKTFEFVMMIILSIITSTVFIYLQDLELKKKLV